MPEFEGENQGNSYIFFGAGVCETKGSIVSGENLPAEVDKSHFGVFGFRPDGTTPVFSGTDNVADVYRVSEGGVFTYDNLSLWHSGTHEFFAWYPYDLTESLLLPASTAEDPCPCLYYTLPEIQEGKVDLDHMVDIMTAHQSADKSDGTVELTFEHRLFALYVVVKNLQEESERSFTINSASIEFQDLKKAALLYLDGTNDIDESGITVTHDYISASSSPIEVPYSATGSGYNLNDSNPFLLLPCTSLKVKVTLDITNAWGEEIPFTIDCTSDDDALAPTGGFQAGYKYILNIKKSDKGIVFAYEIEEWTQKDVDMEFN